jgi:hypothetical protein
MFIASPQRTEYNDTGAVPDFDIQSYSGLVIKEASGIHQRFIALRAIYVQREKFVHKKFTLC